MVQGRVLSRYYRVMGTFDMKSTQNRSWDPGGSAVVVEDLFCVLEGLDGKRFAVEQRFGKQRSASISRDRTWLDVLGNRSCDLGHGVERLKSNGVGLLHEFALLVNAFTQLGLSRVRSRDDSDLEKDFLFENACLGWH